MKMNKFYKKYVCYDPNLTRFSELGNVALNKTFWERSYATTKKFSHIVPGVSDLIPSKSDPFLKLRKFPHSIPKMKSSKSKSSSATDRKCDEDQVSKRISAIKKPGTSGDENYQLRAAKKLKTLILLPQPPSSSVNPFDECWPQTTLAATQSLPNVKHFRPLTRVTSAQRRVSRLPSLSKIIEMEAAVQQHPSMDISDINQLESGNMLLLSYDSPAEQLQMEKEESISVRRLKIRQRHSKPKDVMERSAHSTDSIYSSSQSSMTKKTSGTLKPSKEAQAKHTESESSLSPSELIAMDRMEFWNERRPKRVPPLNQSVKIVENKNENKKVNSLVHRHALKHPLRHFRQKNENIGKTFSQPSQSLTHILDAYPSIPILKRVEIYTSLHKQRKSNETNLNFQRLKTKTNLDTITLI